MAHSATVSKWGGKSEPPNDLREPRPTLKAPPRKLEAVPKVVISFGQEHPCISDISERVSGSHVSLQVNLRQQLNDPLASHFRVKHKVDSKDDSTTTAVYVHKSFVPTVCETVDAVIDSTPAYDVAIIAGFCKTGYHRADVWGRTVVELLNAVKDAEGRARYNCLHVDLHDCHRRDLVLHRLNESLKWLASPWYETDSIDGRKASFAYRCSKKEAAAMQTLTEIWDYVERRAEAINGLARKDCHEEDPPQRMREYEDPPAKRARRDLALETNVPSPPPPPAPPPPAPPQKNRSSSVMDDALEEWAVPSISD